jgi:uncharacterized protein (UPF0332 family)
MASRSRPDVALNLARAEECLAAGRSLAAEGFLVDAVGRAYYCLFHAGQALLATKGLHAKTHRGLASLLQQEFGRPDALRKADLRLFLQAMQMRAASDYDAEATFNPDQVEILMTQAKAFLSRVQGLVG